LYNFVEDGVLGLGRDKSSLVYKLWEKRVIKSPIYSLQSINNEIPLLILGDVNFTELNLTIKDSFKLNFSADMKTQFFYNSKIFPIVPVEINSLYSHITGPYDQLQGFYADLIDKYDCSQVLSLILCNCSNQYPELIFLIENHELYINSSYYFKRVNEK
jgi:hypothetical protein